MPKKQGYPVKKGGMGKRGKNSNPNYPAGSKSVGRPSPNRPMKGERGRKSSDDTPFGKRSSPNRPMKGERPGTTSKQY